MLTPPSGTGKYTTHGPHYAALWSHYAALGPRPNGLRPSGSIMGPSGSIMFGPRAVYFPVSLGQGQHIIPILSTGFQEGKEVCEGSREEGTGDEGEHVEGLSRNGMRMCMDIRRVRQGLF